MNDKTEGQEQVEGQEEAKAQDKSTRFSTIINNDGVILAKTLGKTLAYNVAMGFTTAIIVGYTSGKVLDRIADYEESRELKKADFPSVDDIAPVPSVDLGTDI